MNVKFKINYFTNLGKYSCLIITYLLCDFDVILKIYCNSIKRFHILNVVGFAQQIGLQKLWGYRIQVRIRKMPRIVAANIYQTKKSGTCKNGIRNPFLPCMPDAPSSFQMLPP